MTIWNELSNLFFPRLCPVCGCLLGRVNDPLCPSCFMRLVRTHYDDLADNPLARSFIGIVDIRKATAFLLFRKEGDVQKLIHSFKYHGNKSLAHYLGAVAARELKLTSIFEKVDVIVPVPLHPRKQRQRGYNQSELIADGIASVTGLPVDSTSLRRIRYTETQTGMTAEERERNVSGVFAVESRALEGKHVLLIDDVVTTGATAIQSARALLGVSGVEVSLLALSTVLV